MCGQAGALREALSGHAAGRGGDGNGPGCMLCGGCPRQDKHHQRRCGWAVPTTGRRLPLVGAWWPSLGPRTWPQQRGRPEPRASPCALPLIAATRDLLGSYHRDRRPSMRTAMATTSASRGLPTRTGATNHTSPNSSDSSRSLTPTPRPRVFSLEGPSVGNAGLRPKHGEKPGTLDRVDRTLETFWHQSSGEERSN